MNEKDSSPVQHKSGRMSIIPSRAVFDPTLSRTALVVLSALGTYGDEDGWCWPSQTTLAERLSISRQAVGKYIHELVNAGYLTSQPQFRKDGGQSTNKYRIVFDLPPQKEAPTPRPRKDEDDEEVSGAQPNAVAGGATPMAWQGAQPNAVAGGATPEGDSLTSHLNDSKNVPKNVPRTEEFASHFKKKKKGEPMSETKRKIPSNQILQELIHFTEGCVKKAIKTHGEQGSQNIQELLEYAIKKRNEIEYFRAMLHNYCLDWDTVRAKKMLDDYEILPDEEYRSANYLKWVLISLREDGILIKKVA